MGVDVGSVIAYLDKKLETFYLPVERQWIEHSRGSEDLMKLWGKILDPEKFRQDEPELGITLIKRYGFSNFEKQQKIKDIYDKQNDLDTKYNKGLQNLARLHGIAG